MALHAGSGKGPGHKNRKPQGNGSASVAAPFATVLGPTDGQFGPWTASPYEGFTVEYASQPAAFPNATYDFTRAGWMVTDSATTDTHATVTHALRNTVTKALRQPAPVGVSPYTTQSALGAVLSTYHFASSIDTITGNPTNNSTLVPPKPGARHVMTANRVWGNSFKGQIVCIDGRARNQKQVAGAVCTLTSATTGVAVSSVATPTVLGHLGDQFAVIGLEVNIDITGLTDNADFTEDWVVYPHFGATSASQRRTVDGTAANLWEFATRTHVKNTTKKATPYMVAVASTGTDESVTAAGVGSTSGLQKVSQTEATVLAHPFLTMQSAMQALHLATSLTGGLTDGCEVHVVDGVTLSGTFSAGTYQGNGELVITRASTSTRAAAVVSFGAVSMNMRHKNIRFYDCSLSRSPGTLQMSGVSAQTVVELCNFDNASRASVPTGTGVMAYMGCAVSNGTTAMMGGGAIPTVLARGVQLLSGSLAIDFSCVVGCDIPAVTAAPNATRAASNIIWAFNKCLKNPTSAIVSDAISHDGIFIAQNDFEFISSTTNPIVRISGDDATATSIKNFVEVANTYAGSNGAGRHNCNYDETNNVTRQNYFVTRKCNVMSQLNNKGDAFHYGNDGNPEGYTALSPSKHIGNWALRNSVDAVYNFINYGNPNPDTEPPEYLGVGSSIGTTSTAQIAVTSLFVNYQGTTFDGVSVYTAGTGGGDNRLKPGVAPRAVIPLEHSQFPYDLAGNARTIPDTIGAYI